MSWYLKKAFRLGPIRFNLSKSGIGVSGGIKGFRVGTGPRGPYVQAGRGGIYYRKSFGHAQGDSPSTTKRYPESAADASPPRKQPLYWPLLVFLSVLVVTSLVYFGVSETIVLILTSALFLICIAVAVLEYTRRRSNSSRGARDEFG